MAAALAAELIGFLGELAAAQTQASADPSFSYPFPSINVGTIRGGEVRNIVAPSCAFDWEIRPILPAQSAMPQQAFAAHVEHRTTGFRQQGGFGPAIETCCVYDTPPLVTERRAVIAGLAMQVMQSNETTAVSFGTKAGLPGGWLLGRRMRPGDIQQAHTPDEWIAVDQPEACIAFLSRLIDDCARP